MPLVDPTVGVPDAELRLRYRFCRQSLKNLLEILQLRDNGKRHHVMKRLLVALRYLANGSFQLISGDALDCSQEYVSRSVTEVVDAIIENRERFIRFPSDETIVRGDADVDPRLPRCIGLIDGTHILLKDVVPIDQRADFVDSKKNISLNVQAVLGANNLWVSVNSSNPGSVHDSRVYQSSRLFLRMRSIPAGYWLCGDSAYGLSPSLLTPYNDPIPGTAEASFNIAHKSVRSTVERGFRKLKRSWAICNGSLRLTPPGKAAKAVLACFCLHNYQKMMGEPEPDVDDEVVVPEDEEGVNFGAEALAGMECRRAYTIEFFA
ncbi:conserved hypothetical protein [Perkinsus marinus ATCC 50983]|uniref:Putative nuclease HARBI1 n=1 Tax=Perkinsus marinus (strain ATCC 50983 / TXsc) TaxID=423536 RepID=C5KMW5_PERM5|nr:conserved hypothetical protein [Perkinsus marinus ATCC 50983]EER14273.1 conserved hypothetical protein [Perkinsus marinus ATCC 50983]|eukprot:XP_002782478.1 conserved hypothetical protein [Perkinsus marinus ATCC 50983]